jgi:predicted  nucleic acid-binding Zn-ribbon protein
MTQERQIIEARMASARKALQQSRAALDQAYRDLLNARTELAALQAKGYQDPRKEPL